MDTLDTPWKIEYSTEGSPLPTIGFRKIEPPLNANLRTVDVISDSISYESNASTYRSKTTPVLQTKTDHSSQRTRLNYSESVMSKTLGAPAPSFGGKTGKSQFVRPYVCRDGLTNSSYGLGSKERAFPDADAWTGQAQPLWTSACEIGISERKLVSATSPGRVETRTLLDIEGVSTIHISAMSLDPMQESKFTISEAQNRDHRTPIDKEHNKTDKLLTEWGRFEVEVEPALVAETVNDAVVVKLDSVASEQAMSLQVSTKIDCPDTTALETIALRIVKRIQKKDKFYRFAISIITFTASALLLAVIVFIIIILPDVLYKLSFGVVFFVVFSYLGSVLVKHIYCSQNNLYISINRFMHHSRKRSKAQDEDMKHLKLIKQDTTCYLQALRKKVPKRVF